jgi:menaquinone-9 beta-reductase
MRTIPEKIDICIVGAGPAGATTALFLAKMGIPHLLLDKDTFPRDKICGDGLDLKVMRVLNQLDPRLVQELVETPNQYNEAWGGRFIAPNGMIRELLYEPKGTEIPFPMFLTAKRLHFDNFLIQKLDAQYTDLQLNTEVKTIERVPDGVKITMIQGGVTYETITKLVIGADGDHSVVLRHLSERKIDRKHYAAALRQYHSGIEGMHPKGLLEVYFPKDYPLGYFWIFPLPNGEANVGFGMTSEVISKKKVNLRVAFADLLKNDPYLAPRFKNAVPLEKAQGWGLPLASRRRKNYGDRYLLAGDAGSLINPLTGEGIGTAMLSGYIAANFVQKALEKQDFSENAFKAFQRETHKRVKKEIFGYQVLTHPFLQGWFNSIINAAIKYNRSGLSALPKWLNTAFNVPIEMDYEA